MLENDVVGFLGRKRENPLKSENTPSKTSFLN